MQGRSARGFSVSTRCETVGEFITTFWDRSDESSIVVNVAEPRAVGTECAFAILLVNKKPVLAGTCVVLDVYTNANNPFKRVGMRLGIQRMGPDSERVFAELASTRAARSKRKGTQLGMPALSRTTTVLPIVTTEIALGDAVVISAAAIASEPAVPIAVPRKMTQPMRSLTRTPKPAITAVPAVAPVPTIAPKSSNTAVAPAATLAKPRALARVETRTPGSDYILPANPLAAIPDASLEGFVERQIDAALEPMVDALPAPTPPRLARGTLDDAAVESVDDDEPTKPSETTFDATPVAEPLPPPPVAAAIVETVVEAPIIEALPAIEPVAQTAPRRRRGRWFALAATMAVLVACAGAFAVYAGCVEMPMKSTPAASPDVEPTLTLSTVVANEMTVEGTEHTEAAPPAPIAQPIHAVLIRTLPGSARVVVGDQSFGTTPTYVKIPANTPVDIQIARAGFEPIIRTVTSTHQYEQVVVRLQPTKARKVIRPRVQAPAQPAVVDLSNL